MVQHPPESLESAAGDLALSASGEGSTGQGEAGDWIRTWTGSSLELSDFHLGLDAYFCDLGICTLRGRGRALHPVGMQHKLQPVPKSHSAKLAWGELGSLPHLPVLHHLKGPMQIK